MNKPLGLFGGTFDPIHNGHLRCAFEVQQQLGLDQVLLLPNHIPPHKASPGIAPHHRLAMVELAIEGCPNLGVDRRELDRSEPSYTVETLAQYRQEQGDRPLCFIVGMDSLLQFHRWHQPEQILELAHLVVCHRPDHPLPADSEAQGWLARHGLDSAEQLQQTPAGGIWLQPVTQLAIASSTLRAQMARGLAADFLLPPQVVAYIDRHRLYRHDDGGTTAKPL
ncbi:nicotinate-nucleotide adenylyltransferase [Ferrimonas marina]|uniref:Probable nicotinate-nucleotide adenylyltransferase n=1 Tax=Ferrimonas marina TaxID=299255 RepID=A0A1M5W0M6_9GAMM|nr:nicotinate-nucleotide adenylyltransferase [Ferrimonas marina]SHH80764.1 nicotinate-nucleotide adenylyltransferase [Ferrimonas marina]